MSKRRRLESLEDSVGGGRGKIEIVYLIDEHYEPLPEGEQARRLDEARARLGDDDVLMKVVCEEEEDASAW